MKYVKRIEDAEIAFKNHTNALETAKALLNEGYVVLLSKEEELMILNYSWSPNHANRNDVIFRNREDFEDEYFEEAETDD